MSDLHNQTTTEGLPVAPSLEPSLALAHIRQHRTTIDKRILFIILLSVGLAVVAAFVAHYLVVLINLFTNLAFYQRYSTLPVSPSGHHLGYMVVFVPVIGGFLVGLMARFGSKAIRGHGIPEAMEQVLLNESRIPFRMIFLKPLSAAIAIGTGGPFGAEGPIIATGGAFGSMFGQFIKTSASERKTLLAAGAAAGMTAIFGSPVAAVLLAIELLLFEYRPRSFLPVAFAAATAAAIHVAYESNVPFFKMADIIQPGGLAILVYIVIGAIIGLVAVGVTKSVYLIEDLFERLPIHWMWWPILGGLAIGLVGLVAPDTMGVGYKNIDDVLSGALIGRALFFLMVMKFISWSISLGSGTSGGTLAPLFTIGGALGSLLANVFIFILPQAGIDIKIAALVGMAALFAGASRALFASVIFAFETTRQPLGLLPLLGGCAASYLVSSLLMKGTIMTEKILRRGTHVPTEYGADGINP